MTELEFPVIIVGGGPVGMSTALELEHHGIACCLIEPRLAVEHSRPRAKTTSARTMELFRRWGLADALREAARFPDGWSSRITFAETVTGPEIVHLDGCLGLSTPTTLSPERGLQISQGLVEETLRSAIAERPLITTHWGWRAIEVTQTVDYTVVRMEAADGSQKQMTARWVVGADGPRSTVRSAMGAEYEGSSGGRPNVNITFLSKELQSLVPHPPSIHYWVLNSDEPGVVGPLDLQGTWWAISTGTESVESDLAAANIVKGLVGAEIDVQVLATDPWQARLLLADRYREGSLFIVGDAAHQNPPWGGHGFNTGVGDAVNLAWKMAAVHQGWAPEALLDSYQSERRPIAVQTIELAAKNMATLSADLAGPVSSSGQKRHEDLRAETIRETKGSEFYADGLIFGYGYGPSSGLQSPSPEMYIPREEPGNRLPHRLVNGRPVFDTLGTDFSVLGDSTAIAPLLEAAERRGIPVVHVPTAEPEILVVRPDQHIAWVGYACPDPDEILDQSVLGFGSRHSAESAEKAYLSPNGLPANVPERTKEKELS